MSEQSVLPALLEPRYVAIGKLFSERNTFSVPKYQRGYAWESEEIEDFIKDVNWCYDAKKSMGRKEHFFGGIVCVEKRIPGAGHRHFELVDGQQRLATFVMLGASILKECLNLEQLAIAQGDNAAADLLHKRATRLKEQYICHEDEQNRKPIEVHRLTLSNADEIFFRSLLSGSALTTNEVERESHKRLKNAYNALQKNIKSKLNGLIISAQIDVLRCFMEVVNEDCTFIQITTSKFQEAYRLFQVLNDRGVSLSAGDLLRARSLELLDAPAGRTHQPVVVGIWDEILADPPAKTDDFLRWFYSAHKGEAPRKIALFDEFVAGFFPATSAESIAETDAQSLVHHLTTLRAAVLTMRQLIEGEWPFDVQKTNVTQWDRQRLTLLIKELGHTNCMPLIYAASSATEANFTKILSLVERFAFRYKYVCNQHIARATRVYLEEAQALLANPTSYKPTSLESKLKTILEEHATEAVFKQALSEWKYTTGGGNKPLKYLLITLDDYWVWYSRRGQGRPKPDKTHPYDFSNTTIEHIYPRSVPKSATDTELEKIKHSLGNLTLLGAEDNDKVGNKSLKDKLPILSTTASRMNTDLAKKKNWKKADVAARQSLMVELASKIFTL